MRAHQTSKDGPSDHPLDQGHTSSRAVAVQGCSIIKGLLQQPILVSQLCLQTSKLNMEGMNLLA